MKSYRVLLALGAVLVLVGVAYVNQAAESTAAKMATAADTFLEALQPDQRAKAVFAFDDKERTNFHFVPLQDKMKQTTRKGLPLEAMTKAQRDAALALVKAGTSERGYTAATTVMSLEAILNELEKGGAMVRNPDWYFFSVFGRPSKSGKWGWRVEGHHLALNFTLDGGKVVAATPAFFGANPATVMAGPRKGLRTLPEAEDLAKDLFGSLDEGQKKVALQDKPFREIEQANTKPTVTEPKGVAAAKMTEKQRATLVKLIQAYAERMPPDIADVELRQVRESGIDKVHFAYSGGVEKGQGYTYRVQGPTFVIEFLNMQADGAKNPANHIHSAWRNLQGDFGTAARP